MESRGVEQEKCDIVRRDDYIKKNIVNQEYQNNNNGTDFSRQNQKTYIVTLTVK